MLTREGRPVADLVPRAKPSEIDLEAGEAYLRAAGAVRSPGFIAPDFDDPLPEDSLLRPLPDA